MSASKVLLYGLAGVALGLTIGFLELSLWQAVVLITVVDLLAAAAFARRRSVARR